MSLTTACGLVVLVLFANCPNSVRSMLVIDSPLIRSACVGDNVTMNCIQTGSFPVDGEWMQDDTPVSRKMRKNVFAIVHTLTIVNVSRKDSGTYDYNVINSKSGKAIESTADRNSSVHLTVKLCANQRQQLITHGHATSSLSIGTLASKSSAQTLNVSHVVAAETRTLPPRNVAKPPPLTVPSTATTTANATAPYISRGVNAVIVIVNQIWPILTSLGGVLFTVICLTVALFFSPRQVSRLSLYFLGKQIDRRMRRWYGGDARHAYKIRPQIVVECDSDEERPQFDVLLDRRFSKETLDALRQRK